eukprot:354400-Chlamydomonas_euryale.AAC.3
MHLQAARILRVDGGDDAAHVARRHVRPRRGLLHEARVARQHADVARAERDRADGDEHVAAAGLRVGFARHVVSDLQAHTSPGTCMRTWRCACARGGCACARGGVHARVAGVHVRVAGMHAHMCDDVRSQVGLCMRA